jgi:hypothetical protein
LYERYSPRHPNCHHLRSEQIEVEGMNISKVEGMDMVEEQDYPTNHRLEEEGMNMVGSNMMEVDDMDTVEEYFHPMNHRSEVGGMDTVDTGIREDRAAELDVVEREPEGIVLTRHWIGEGAVEFVFKRSNFNLNRPIRSRRVTAAHRPQRQVVVQTLPPGPTLA